MNSYHSDPNIYVTIAQHAFEDCNDIESSRRYFSIGMEFHEDFQRLYLEDFYIEAKYFIQTGCSSLQTVLKKYNRIIQHFKYCIDIHIELVNIVLDDKFKMATQLQCIVVRYRQIINLKIISV